MVNTLTVPASAPAAAKPGGCDELALFGDPATLRAAAAIQAAFWRLTLPRREKACRHLREYPAAGIDSRRAGVKLPGAVSGQRSIHAALTAAGGADLADAAARLAGWAGLVVRFSELRWVLLGWMPDGIVSEPATEITRRLLCDAAGLAAVNPSTVVSAAAMTGFSAAGRGLADDVGLIDERALRQFAAGRGWVDSFDALAEACGFIRICGVLSARRGRTTATKAALIRLGYPATVPEVAEVCGRRRGEVSTAISVCESVSGAGWLRWVPDSAAAELFAAAVGLDVTVPGLVDDSGLVAGDKLAETAARAGWAGSVEDFASSLGFVRLFGRWATADTATPAVKAALGSLRRPATVDEIVEMTDRGVEDVSRVLRSCETIIACGDGLWRTCTDPRFADFVAAASAARDDVGVIDRAGLETAGAAGGWIEMIDEFAASCGYRYFNGQFASKRTHRAAVKAALLRLGDDAGLVEGDKLAETAARAGWAGSVEDFASSLGFVRLFGHWATADTVAAAVKAALGSLRRPATVEEIVEMTGRNVTGVRRVLRSCETIIACGDSVWSTCTDPRFADFVAAASAVRDEVGVIDRAGLEAAGAAGGWIDLIDEFAAICGYRHINGQFASMRTHRAAVKAALLALGDDAGLVEGDKLAESAARARWAGSVEDFASSLGFVRLFGHWATADTVAAAVKAALGSLQRPATVEEIVEMTGRNVTDVRRVLRSCKTIVACGDGAWRTCTDPRFSDFVAAASAVRDEVGVIDRAGLEAAGAAGGWIDLIDEFAAICGYRHFNGQFASMRTPRAAAKAALLALGGAASVADVAQAAQMTKNVTARALTACPSTRFDRTSRCWVVTPVKTARSAPDPATASSVPVCRVDAPAAARFAVSDPGAASTGAGPARPRRRDANPQRVEVLSAVRRLGRPVTITEIVERTSLTRKTVYTIFDTESSVVQVAPRRWNVDTFDGTLQEFAAAVAGCRDDVGLIDEPELRRIAETRGWSDTLFERLAHACGFVRLNGLLSAETTTAAAVKATLTDLDRPAELDEIAILCQMERHHVRAQTRSADSMVSVSPTRCVAEDARGGVYAQFAAAVQANRDDVGLIDEHRVAEIAAREGWDLSIETLISDCGLTRTRGRLVWASTAAAKTKAALLELGRSATLSELCDMTGLVYGRALSAVKDSTSVRRIATGTAHHPGLFTVV